MARDHKPLPALPSLDTPLRATTLSVESRAQRSKLIWLFLSNVDDPGLQARRDGWVVVIEEALDDLSYQMVQGQWLSAVKRGKLVKQGCLQQSEVAPVTNPKRDGGEKPLPVEPMAPLVLLRKFATLPPTESSTLKSGHLVICVAPHSNRPPLPLEDSGFDIAPVNIGCTFSPGRFSLQEGPVDPVLLGHDGILPNMLETSLRLIGGTFGFKGLITPMQHAQLSKVLQLSIYTHLALVLEQHLLIDSHIAIKYPRPPKLSIPSPSTPNQRDKQVHVGGKQLSSDIHPSPSWGANLRKRTSMIPSSFNIGQFLSKRHTGIGRSQSISVPYQTQPSRGNNSLDLTALPSSGNPTKQREEGKSVLNHSQSANLTHAEEATKPASHHPRLHRFSFLAPSGHPDRQTSLRRKLQAHLSSHSSPPRDAVSSSPPRPFFNALNHVEANMALLSTSPSLHLPRPKVIVDLVNRENAYLEANPASGAKGGLKWLKGDERVALTNLIGWDANIMHDNGEGNSSKTPVCGLAGSVDAFIRHQEISVLWSLQIPKPAGLEQEKGAEKGQGKEKATDELESTPSTLTTSSTHTAGSMSTDLSTSSIITSSTSSAGNSGMRTSSDLPKSSKAKVPSSAGHAYSACGKPHWRTLRYSSSFSPQPGMQADQSLGHVLTALILERQLPCDERPDACVVPRGRHERWIVHSGVRVTCKVLDATDPEKAHQVLVNESLIDAAQQVDDKVDEDKGALESPKENQASQIQEKAEWPTDGDADEVEEDEVKHLQMWLSCSVCGASSAKKKMNDGTYLLPFPKFLELLIYSPKFAEPSPAICEHTSPTLFKTSRPPINDNDAPLPDSKTLEPPDTGTTLRYNLIRHFALPATLGAPMTGGEVQITLRPMEDIFELRVPRLQIVRGVERGRRALDSTGKAANLSDSGTSETTEIEQKRRLRMEIKRWWEGVADHVDQIEKALNAQSVQKALPRLPSVDDAYDVFEDEKRPGEMTPTTSNSSAFIPTTLTTIQDEATDSSEAGYFPNIEEAVKSVETLRIEEKKLVEGEAQLTTPSVISLAPTVPPKDDANPLPKHDPLPKPPDNDLEITTTQPTTPLQSPLPEDPAILLASLRHTFHRQEQGLYTQLAKTPEGSLNDVRRSFLSVAKGAQKRLYAWQRKHLLEDPVPKKGKRRSNAISSGTASTGSNPGSSIGLRKNDHVVGELKALEPQWWGKGCHVLPGGNVIVREGDWGSIIAHTLTTTDFQLELANLSVVRSLSQTNTAHTPGTPTTADIPGTASSSFFSMATRYRFFSSNAKHQPDPDRDDDMLWHEQEPYSAVISRKERDRDHATTLLSLRDVLRQKAPQDLAVLSPSTSALLPPGPGEPSKVKTKADVQMSTQAAGGGMVVKSSQVVSESAEKRLLQELTQSGPGIPLTNGEKISSQAVSISREGADSDHINADIKQETAESVASGESEASEHTVREHLDEEKGVQTKREGKRRAVFESNETIPPPPPPKDKPSPKLKSETTSKVVPPATIPPAEHIDKLQMPLPPPPSTSSGFASALASGLQNVAMRFMPGSEPPSRHPSQSNTPNTGSNPRKHHNLLQSNIASIDERPHIKYDWTIGKRLKFSCTAYYAKQFDLLRRRCGIQDIYAKSLSRSMNWSAEGGKSRSNFWKTEDDRFIIKTLVNAWNVADLQTLIELAPSYFRYMDATANKATVLAKLVGFYTIEIRNLETGAVQSKADVLVMENLFYDRTISKTFDLKGIHGRKVKTQGHTSKTLFDSEWIEGQQRTLTLVHPHSKVVFRDAIKSDAEFLAKSNIMDYSLLVGVDDEKKQIACGLVDTIGSYTFAKTLEYKAKHGLQTGMKEVTVVPPDEYQERFIKALDGYFVACPDKWSKPLDELKTPGDSNSVPAIF